MRNTAFDHKDGRALGVAYMPEGLFPALTASWREVALRMRDEDTLSEHLENNPSLGQNLTSVAQTWAEGGCKGSIVAGYAQTPSGKNLLHFRIHKEAALDHPDDQPSMRIIDPTWQQFPPGTVFVAPEDNDPEFDRAVYDVLYEPEANQKLRKELDLLQDMLATNGYYSQYTVHALVTSLERRFKNVKKRVETRAQANPEPSALVA